MAKAGRQHPCATNIAVVAATARAYHNCLFLVEAVGENLANAPQQICIGAIKLQQPAEAL